MITYSQHLPHQAQQDEQANNTPKPVFNLRSSNHTNAVSAQNLNKSLSGRSALFQPYITALQAPAQQTAPA